jgi:hypothetical protein
MASSTKIEYGWSKVGFKNAVRLHARGTEGQNSFNIQLDGAKGAFKVTLKDKNGKELRGETRKTTVERITKDMVTRANKEKSFKVSLKEYEVHDPTPQGIIAVPAVAVIDGNEVEVLFHGRASQKKGTVKLAAWDFKAPLDGAVKLIGQVGSLWNEVKLA